MSRAAGRNQALADFGLVALVAGGTIFLVLGIVTLGIGALLGRIPLLLAIMVGLSILVTMTGLVLTVGTAGNRERPERLPAAPEETR